MSKHSQRGTSLHLRLDRRLGEPLYQQLYERLRDEILAHTLEPGARLPSTRTLAIELGVSRNTTALAYQLLLLEGYLEGRVGDGTRVARAIPQAALPAQPDTGAEDVAPEPSLSARAQALMANPLPDSTRRHAHMPLANTFRIGQPDLKHFPFATWARLQARHARHTLASFQPGDFQGYRPLREAIATRVGITRGVRCSASQVIITAGSQGALDLTARTLLNPGDAVWVEDPGYPGARGALVAAEAQLVGVKVDAHGLVVAAGRELGPQARMAVVTPSHQFPTGVTMSLSRRLALLDWAREAGSWIVEDDYDSEYRYSGRPLEALQGMDASGRVIYIGTFSKVLFPSLRLGYVIVPPPLVDAFVAMRAVIDTHPPMLEQLTLADFIAEGHYARHIRAMRGLYLERRNALVAALASELGNCLVVTMPEAGLHLAAWLPPGFTAHSAEERIAAQGERVLGMTQGTGDETRHGLMLGFACSTPDELRAGVHRVSAALA